MARVGEEFPLQRPGCGGDIRLIVFSTEPEPIRKILTHLAEPLEPPPLSPARGPRTNLAELVQAHAYRDAMQASPDELTAIDIHSLWAVPDATHACRETANWDAVCADAIKTPTKRVRGVARNPLRTPGPFLPRLTSRSSAGRPLR
jgi:hypothetical protein